MEPTVALKEAAGWIARSDQSEAAGIRLRAYLGSPRFDTHRYLCPRCWVANGIRSPMRSVPGTNEYDVLVCNNCSADVVIPFD